MKQGQSVYLATTPDMRGSVSHVHKDGFEVVWNPFVFDREEALKLKVLGGFERTRVRYFGQPTNVVIGVPEKD